MNLCENRVEIKGDVSKITWDVEYWKLLCSPKDWGTTSGPIDAHTSIDGNTMHVDFDTAWCPPIGVYQALEKKGYQIRALFREGGLAFAGVYDGDLLQWDMEVMLEDAKYVPQDLMDYVAPLLDELVLEGDA